MKKSIKRKPKKQSDSAPEKSLASLYVPIASAGNSGSGDSILLGNKRISKKAIIIFALVFGMIGGYYVFRSSAAAQIVASLQAETMSLPAGASIINDNGANSGQAILLTQNNTSLSGSVSLASPAESFAVIAKGAKCKGSWPSITVSIGGSVALGPTKVSSTSWKSYSVAKSLASDTKTVDITYSAGRSDCQGKLYVDVINFYGPVTTIPIPEVSLSASPTSVIAGQASTLTWSSSNANSCVASGNWSGTKTISGSESAGSLNTTSSYTLTCTGTGGTASKSVMVNVDGGTSTTCPSWTNGFGNFGVDNWPNACWRPYADSSPWNMPIPDNPRLVSNSAAMVNRLNGFGVPMNILTGNSEGGAYQDYNHPAYYSKDTSVATGTDPIFTINCVKFGGQCPMDGMQIRLPEAAKPALGGDAHFTVIDQKTKVEYSFWQVTSKPAGGGTLDIGWWYGPINIDGDGLQGGGTAMMSGMAGMIRAQEMTAGKINHAIFMTANCSNGSYVYPAFHGTGTCSDTSNAPPLGTRFQLNLTPTQIDSIKENGVAIPAWKKTILKAMAEYGAIFGDGTGGSWGLSIQSDRTYTSFGKPALMHQFAQANNWYQSSDGLRAGLIKGGTLPDGSLWTSHLRVIDPCVSQKSCQ